MSKVKTWFAHASGRFDRSISLLRRAVEATRKHSVLITGTELAGRPYADVERALGSNPNWDYVQSHGRGKDDCYITWDNRVLKHVYHDAIELSKRTFRRSPKYGGKVAATTHALVGEFRFIETNKQVFVIVAHMPLSNTPLRAAIWLSCALGLRRLIKRLRRANPNAEFVFVADLNKDYRRLSSRALVRRTIAKPLGLVQAWGKGILPKAGTHRKRLIDGAILSAKFLAGAPELLADDAASDHRNFRYPVRP